MYVVGSSKVGGFDTNNQYTYIGNSANVESIICETTYVCNTDDEDSNAATFTLHDVETTFGTLLPLDIAWVFITHPNASFSSKYKYTFHIMSMRPTVKKIDSE